MTSPILTRHKWMLRAHGQHIVIVRGAHERFTHPLMKALLWALYLPTYPNISVEIRLADKYKPDVVAFEPGVALRAGVPVFWGEAGQVNRHKIEALVRRYPQTHFAIAKWDARLEPHLALIQKALAGVPRHAPLDVIRFPEDSDRFIDADGMITLTHDEVTWVRL
ncbi:MAG: hypothetical protein K8J31_07025 [Anaerolineae bacterium]|nr:hypothetical protein [Anaerolineae bacterium]